MLDKVDESVLLDLSYFYDFAYETFSVLLEMMPYKFDHIKPFLVIEVSSLDSYRSKDDHNVALGMSVGEKVILYLFDLMRYNRKSDCHTVIVNTLVHELFHCTQITDYNMYGNGDISYWEQVELSVVAHTWNFINTNRGIIEAKLDIKLNIDDESLLSAMYPPFIPPKVYERASDPAMYLTNLIFMQLSEREALPRFYEYIYDTDSVKVIVNIGGVEYCNFYVKKDKVYLPLDTNYYTILTDIYIDNKTSPSEYRINGNSNLITIIVDILDKITPMKRIEPISD